MYHYWGFGLNIASELEFPELLPASFQQVDLLIKMGQVPVEIAGEKTSYTDMEYILSDNEYLLDVKKVAKYYVIAGKEITIEPYGEIDSRSVRIFLLATVMAVVLLQRGLIPLHASGIVKDGQLILFTGDSGAGKSTTLAYLVSNGYRIFTDDICVLSADPANDKSVSGIASYPMLKLWDDAVTKLAHDAFSDKTFTIRPGMDKYGYFFYDTFITSHLPIARIFILKTGPDIEAISSRKLSGMEAFGELERQAYRKYLISNQQQRAIHFKTISTLTNNCTVYEVRRPQNGTVEQLVTVLKALF